MTKYPCSSISLEYAFFSNITDSFIGQRVVVTHLETEIIGRVDSCSLEQTKVRLYGDVAGFVTSKTVGSFLDSFLEIPLSPSLLGRHLDFFGNPLDALAPVVPVSKSPSFYVKTKIDTKLKSEIVSEKDWLIDSKDFRIQKGEVKSYSDFDTLLPLLSISNLALIVVELDYQSKKFKNLQQDLTDNNLDQISIFSQSQSQNDISIAPFCISQVANYLASQLGFDVLILVAHSQLLQNTDNNPFYFVSQIDQLASFEANNSITVIKI
jgi:hypothetical protein